MSQPVWAVIHVCLCPRVSLPVHPCPMFVVIQQLEIQPVINWSSPNNLLAALRTNEKFFLVYRKETSMFTSFTWLLVYVTVCFFFCSCTDVYKTGRIRPRPAVAEGHSWNRQKEVFHCKMVSYYVRNTCIIPKLSCMCRSPGISLQY